MMLTPDALKAIAAPYLVYIKIAIYGLAVAALIGLGFKWGWSLASHRYDAAKAAEAAQHVKDLEAAREAERASYEKSQQASAEYQSNLAKLDKSYRDALARIGSVRVRVTAPGSVPQSSPASGRPDATHAGADVPGAAGSDTRDIAADLILLARDADQCRQQLTALQGWAASR